jgi:hypothetical protein
MTLLSRAKALLELAERRGPIPSINSLRVGSEQYLVAVWDLAPELARRFIDTIRGDQLLNVVLESVRDRVLEAESIARSIMTAGLAAVEQARREEREACAQIAEAHAAEATALGERWEAEEIADDIRARGEP